MISDRTLERVLRSSRAVALYGDLVRLAIAGGLLLAIATALVYYGQLVLMVITDYKMNDFGKFYYSAQEYLAGRDMYGPTPATSHRFPDGSTRQFLNMNPPHFQLLMVPFALLPRHIAFCLWWVLSLTSLAVSVRLVRHELNWRWTPARLLWFAAAATTSAITGTVVATGQLTFLLLLPLTLAWIYARRGRWTAAAVALGLLASIKPFLGMFALYFIVTRRHRSLQVMLLAALAATLAGLIVAGAESYSRWFESLAAVEWSWAPMNASVRGLLARSFGPNPFFTPIADGSAWIGPLSIALSLGIIVVSLLTVRRLRQPQEVDWSFAGLLLAAQLASPIGWVYYGWLLFGPIAAVAAHPGRRTRTAVALAGIATAGLLCPLFWIVSVGQSGWLAASLGSVYWWSFFSLWLGWLYEIRAVNRATDASSLRLALPG